ncbi:MAG TPA: hypothetical protein VFS48_00540 [Solirubrobacterales bacterium]|nr:hypothetical protein [Solirubrobacterales bacterium]
MKFQRDPETVASLRDFLATPVLLGPVAHRLSDDAVVEHAEHIATKMVEALPSLDAAVREAAAAWGQIAKNFQRAFRGALIEQRFEELKDAAPKPTVDLQD